MSGAPVLPMPSPAKAKGKLSASPSGERPKMSFARNPVVPKAPRIILYAVEGFGKTTTAAHAPESALVMVGGETGYETLVSAGAVPEIDTAWIKDWPQLLSLLDDTLAMTTIPYKTISFDALFGLERICHEFVCARDYKNDWSDKGFLSYQSGFETSVDEWRKFLVRLDQFRERGVTTLLLGHSQVKPMRNPLGADYDRYVCNIHHKTWAPTMAWGDYVLFGNFLTIVDKKGGRAKGIGGQTRIIYTQHHDAYDAKTRTNMPAEIELSDDPAENWQIISSHIPNLNSTKGA